MSRGRFTSQQLFQQQVERLQKQRTQLLRQRNFTQFTKRISRQMTPSYRQSQETDQATRKNDFDYRSSKQISPPTTNSPGVKEVKMMLEDIMKNSQKHGMNHQTSMIYLRNIKNKLQVQLRMLESKGVRSSPQMQKLRDLKLFIDKIIQSQSDPRTTYATSTQKSYRPTTQEVNKRSLERIPEITHPSIDNSSSNQGSYTIEKSGEEISDENESSSVQQVIKQYNRLNYDFKKKPNQNNKVQTPRKQKQVPKPISSNPVLVLQSLEAKLMKEISHLRTQNSRLTRQLSQNRRRTPSNNTHRPNYHQDQTIIHQLNQQPQHQSCQSKHFEQQNIQLKNRIRTLEMQLLNWKSLRNIGSKNDMKITQQKLYQELDIKDQQIARLRKQTQRLTEYLERSKQDVQSLKSQVRQLNKLMDNRNRNPSKNRYQTFNDVRHIGDSQRYVIRTVEHSSARTPVSKQYQGIQNKTDVLNRNYSNFGERSNLRNPEDQKQRYGFKQMKSERQSHIFGNKREQETLHYDKIGQYRKLLHNLKSIKK